MTVTRPIPVGILGATGAVGQAFVRILSAHPWFRVAAVAASDQSAGRPYGEVVRWRESTSLPETVSRLQVSRCEPFDLPLVFSALDNSVAGPVETAFAEAGALVITNASAHRMDPLVPLLIAEVNAGHLDLLARQRERRRQGGGIVANPNCSTAALVMALAPLHAAFGVERVFAATMQAVSGAGYPGVPSLDILGNVIPWIPGEEEKIEQETRKLLGRYMNGAVEPAAVTVSAHANRVAVEDGHTVSVSVGLARRTGVEQAVGVLRDFTPDPFVAALPSTPDPVIVVESRPDHPQPARDRDRGGGMTATVGRVRACPLLDLRFTVMAHNRIRGAAGGAVQLGELLVSRGLVAHPGATP